MPQSLTQSSVLSPQSSDVWRSIVESTEPVDVDVPFVVAKLADRSRPNRLVVDVLADDGRRLGWAAVFPNGWYPGSQRREFSHYFSVLDRSLAGLETRGEQPRLRIQLLRAVNVQGHLGRDRPYVVLLKFVVAPELAIPGSRVERVYHCPLSGFYRDFLNLGSDVLRDASPPQFVAGEAIHRGYARAARAYLETQDDAPARAAYLGGVLDAWEELFPYLLLDDSTGPKPTQLYRQPIEAVNAVLGRCRRLYQDRDGPLELLQERLFFSPVRGISGRADRIVSDARGRELWELKTKGGWAVDKDPLSGRTAPGGIQALAYHEILNTLDGAPPRTFVEVLDPKEFKTFALDGHPVVTRAGADPNACDDRYLDLVAQARNVAAALESGLLTGYDREKLADMARQGPRLQGLSADFDLYGSAPPCGFCPAGQRGLCGAAHTRTVAPWFEFFRHIPDLLYEYWAWFHGQLKQAERLDRERLHRLVSVPAERLEREDGICVADLRVLAVDGHRVTLGRDRRIETRLREDDRVLVTRIDRPPGELYSVEATLREVDAERLVLDAREPLHGDIAYRVDQLGFWDRGEWQLEGLTDFLVGSMQASGVRGRRVELDELPRLSRVVLGIDPPTPPKGAVAGPLAPGSNGRSSDQTDLNPVQAAAVEAACGLEPGEALLVQGPPGTGKTTLIAHLARRLVIRDFWSGAEQPRPVLVLANTHRACDEVVLKLHRLFPDLRPYLVRLGPARSGMEPEVRQHVISERVDVHSLRSKSLIDDGPTALMRLARLGRAMLREAQIFVGTLAGANRPELRGLEFSTIVVDETGQATEPAALQALRHAVRGYRSRLVLIGDHRQLPPVVPDGVVAPAPLENMRQIMADARAGREAAPTSLPGLRVSLFERLALRWPEAVLTLSDQYRMCGPISDLVSETFYDGRLRPASVAVANRRFDRLLAEIGADLSSDPFAARVLDPAYPVVLVDTSLDPGARETARPSSGAIEDGENPREAELIGHLLAALLGRADSAAAGAASEIGVISPYRRQNNRIRQELRQRLGGTLADQIRVDTVDRFQGGERDVIFLSLVASNLSATIGVLQADWRRMDVAISRACAKLVIVGDRQTFTRPSTAAEEPAKARYRTLFEIADRLVRNGVGLILSAPTAAVAAKYGAPG